MNAGTPPLDPSKLVWRTANIVGGISLAVGYIGPAILYPSSNLGPILGILVTGPIGWLAGAYIGIVRSVRIRQDISMRQEPRWLAATWALSLLYVFWSVFIWSHSPTVALTEVALLCLGVTCAALVLYGRKSGAIPGSIQHFRIPIMIAALLTVVTLIFPPIRADATGQSGFAFLMDVVTDPRFDASHQVPELKVDGSALALEWLILITLALAVGFAIRGLSFEKTP